MSEFPERIVYVDDTDSMRAALRISLEASDEEFILVTCRSGSELLSRIRELHPDLILLDLRMPDMSGPDTIEALRKIEDYEHTPVIFVTGETQVKMDKHYKKLGVIGVIHKPLELSTLSDTIKALWQERDVEKTAA